MNMLVVGQGGREHAIVKALSESASVSKLFAMPGNPGMTEAICIDESPQDPKTVVEVCRSKGIETVVIGPENLLADGLADALRAEGLGVVGPNQSGAELEASKATAKVFMDRYGIPTAPFDVVTSLTELEEAMPRYAPPYVLKADGLAAGKGVFICEDVSALMDAGRKLFEEKVFGDAGAKAVIEAFQPGYEISFFFLTNSREYVALPLAQDHKRLQDGDSGPNTGGMGTVAPVPLAPALYNQILQEVVKPTVKGFEKEGFIYNGVVFVGLMMTSEGPKVIEYNVRFGDPETQVLLPLLDGDWGGVFRKLSEGEISPLKWKDKASCCVVLAAKGYPENPQKGVTIEGVLDPSEDGYFLHAGTRSEDGVWKVNGGRVLNAMGTGPSITDAITASYKVAEKAKWEGLQKRMDIGKQFRGPIDS